MKPSWIIRKQTGAAAVEFAIVLPLLLLIVFGIVEWSLYLFNDHIITDASRRGARLGILQESPRIPESDIRAEVLEYTGNNLMTFETPRPTIDPEVKNLTKSPPSGPTVTQCETFGDDLQVTVSYNYTFLLLPAFTFGRVSQSIPITARTVMKCE